MSRSATCISHMRAAEFRWRPPFPETAVAERAALAGTRWSIHDVVLDDLSTNYAGPGTAFEIANAWPTNPLNTVTINHVTAFPDSTSSPDHHGKHRSRQRRCMDWSSPTTSRSPASTPCGTRGAEIENCAFSDVPITSISNCFKSYTFANNALIAAPPAVSARQPGRRTTCSRRRPMMFNSPTTTAATAETTSFSRAARTRTRAATARISEPTLWDLMQCWQTSNNLCDDD